MRARGAAAIVAGMLGLTSSFASAQSAVEIRTTAPEKPRQFQIVEPGPATREVTRPREAEFYGTDVRVRHEPAFIEPFVGQTQGGTKYGLSGWTSPSTPVGSYVSQATWGSSGTPALGISIVWDSAPVTSAARVSDPR
jgi:hypothetical protein